MSRPKIKLTIVEQNGTRPCHRGHRVWDVFDFDTDRGVLCPMAMHSGFPFVDILRYGGKMPGLPEGQARFCCPDPETILVFQVEKESGFLGSSEK